MDKQRVVIIGAGPAGLTAAYELLKQSSRYEVVIVEATGAIGGISQTVRYKGNRIDIGGHRFFSKSNRVMEWWQARMPLFGAPAKDDLLLGREAALSTLALAPDPEREDRVLLVRNRLSRILFMGKFFDYPVTLSARTIRNLGLWKMVKIGLSYLWVRLFPIKDERSLEDFFINRFGRELYGTFFRDYTEKVWGVACSKIKAEWGAQRIKGLSITKTLIHAFKKLFTSSRTLEQKEVETSLIERFMYPKLGPGQMWELVADEVRAMGGEILMHTRAEAIMRHEQGVRAVRIAERTGASRELACDYLISSMPVRDLIAAMEGTEERVRAVAQGLEYRDFLTVGLLLNRLSIHNETKFKTLGNIVPDNWIYIQEPQVRVGRLQIFNNWSPYLLEDPEHSVWIGLEYFCSEGDDLWSKPDEQMIAFGIEELHSIGVIDPKEVLDGVVIRVPKAYPAYFGTYDDFDTVRTFTDAIPNLFLVGRNGMHRYNNMDHSMLSAMQAVENILQGVTDKQNLWEVNAEKEYHESK